VGVTEPLEDGERGRIYFSLLPTFQYLRSLLSGYRIEK
jgi:hypothetical protein